MLKQSALTTLEKLAYGRISPAEARSLLAGLEMPNAPALMVKKGRWAVDGGYPLGIEGAQMAAKDAIDLLLRP